MTDKATPAEVTPRGNYRVVRVDGGRVVTSALGPMDASAPDGFSHHGRIGETLSVDEGRAAAGNAARALLDALQQSLGSLDRLVAVHRVRGYLATASDFVDHAHVLDAASEVLIDRLGGRARHARSVVGVWTLPFDLPIVIELEGRIDAGDDDVGVHQVGGG